MAQSTDYGYVAVGLISGTVLVLDSSSGTQLTVIQGDGSRLDRLAFDTDGRLAIGWTSGRLDRIEIPGR